METKTCPSCGKKFDNVKGYSKAIWAKRKYCSLSCSNSQFRKPQTSKVCEACGKKFTRQLGGGDGFAGFEKRRFCSVECSYGAFAGANNGNWKGGGSFKMPGGYMGTLIYPGHEFYESMGNPNPSPKGRAHGRKVLEHRLVMAEKLGRALTRSETVHHINGDRADNRLENLQLRTGRHGRGKKHVCADCGSENLVEVAL